MYPIFDPTFIFDSYSCRLEKGTHRAINRLQEFLRKVNKNNTKTCFVLKCDIKKFFDSIDQGILISLIKNKIKDENAIWLLEKIIKSFSALPGKGLPLGNVTSQLFANIYLNELDFFVKHILKIKYYIRYCDDFIFLEEQDALEKIIKSINNFLAQKLKLFLHPQKIIVKKYHQGIDFLGYVSFPHCRILRTKTKNRMIRKIKRKIKDLRSGKITEESFSQTMQSYFGVLKHCDSYDLKKIIKRILENNDSL